MQTHDTTNPPVFKKFPQGDIIEKFNLNEMGVCNGLVIEYFRHIISSEHAGQTPDFMEKLQRKMESTGTEGDRFAKRVALYHHLQTQIFETATPRNIENKYIEKEDITSMFKDLDHIGIVMQSGKSLSGHVIAVKVNRDNEDRSKILGFRIYDPNKGEYIFEKNTPEINTEQFLSRFNSLQREISYKIGGGNTYITVTDIGALISKEGLARESDDYKKEDKYVSELYAKVGSKKDLLVQFGGMAVFSTTLALGLKYLGAPQPLINLSCYASMYMCIQQTHVAKALSGKMLSEVASRAEDKISEVSPEMGYQIRMMKEMASQGMSSFRR